MIFDVRSSSRRCTTVTLVAKFSEEQRLLDRRVAAADDGDRLLAEEESVACRGRGHAMAKQPLLVGEPEHRPR